MRVCLVVNPQAGRGRAGRFALRVWALLRRAFRDLELALSQSARHLTELAEEAVSAGYDLLVGCGGDGTVHHLLAPISGSSMKLGIIPMGSGNDLARSLRLPNDYGAACEIIARGRTRVLDLARIGDRFFASVASVGLSAEVNRLANAQTPSVFGGRWRYLGALFRELRSYAPRSLHLWVDGRELEREVVLAAVGNGAFFGGGFKILPDAEVDDGWLDLCLVNRLDRFRILRAIPSVYRGRHREHPAAEFYRARRIRILSPERLSVFADGEYVQETPVAIEIVPRAIRVIVP
ncbi:MAG: diacylglycerol kinase family lipid kinase [Blastocatellia bacterium]|nr:diacylglycerol kinase family lipid kinase [Blastocatellia bacterium]MCS7157258.1 diacylglycerol kinase family lipid kinase [Blastocatellia bacterium]MDW8167159.1 diacylglycerol kinase family lipid kinase [Acidobacteriota bacterium]MDW8256484.1 diacylglycerol kinase family lipid kinase [Acidobacteriota bacterium]